LKSNFNKYPAVRIPGFENSSFQGWDEIIRELKTLSGNTTLVVECYQGTHYEDLEKILIRELKPDQVYNTSDCMLPEHKVREITRPDVTDDRIFGYLTRLNLSDLFDKNKLTACRAELENRINNLTLIIGTGASLLAPANHILIYADMPRWEIQKRMRRNEVNNVGISNKEDSFEEKYKRGYFVDWRICDRVKKGLFNRWDYFLDTTISDIPKMVTGEAIREAMAHAVMQPFSVMPFFDPGPWGGQWMKEVCDLDSSADNYAWCFNCIPEENSLLIDFGKTTLEIPSVNLVFYKPVELLGDAVHGRFGDEFPIRFDFLDTMDGGNLSLQVHPLTEYIQQNFGFPYTQDESYYLMDAKEDAVVYLGTKEGINGEEMINELRRAQNESVHFDDEKFIQKWPVKKHDHLLIPGGTIHCSGKNSMVLEISATPYIFTFKLWDWGRLGLDGVPRPINIDHGSKVIQWHRTTEWTKENLVNKVEFIEQGEGWREERTGLHEREFIETRRHWFTKTVMHHTNGGVQVFNLVEGDEVIVESPENRFQPFIIHYAETFIVPARIGKFTIRPSGASVGKECATIKAFVRTNA